MSHHRFAQSVVLDEVRHQVVIDGVALPWHMAVDGPVVEQGGEFPITTVHLPILVDSVVEIRTSDRRTFFHQGTEVGRLARDLVRQGFAEAENYPWALPLPIDDEE